MEPLIIGMDPHKHSATVEVIDQREKVLARGRFGTDRDGYQQMLKLGRTYPDRVWAVEGCNGVGRHLAQRLVADGETVLDVPAKLSARARAFDTGQGRKTDPVGAHSVAVVALRTKGLRQVVIDDATVALRLLVDRRDGLGRARTDTVGRTPRGWQSLGGVGEAPLRLTVLTRGIHAGLDDHGLRGVETVKGALDLGECGLSWTIFMPGKGHPSGAGYNGRRAVVDPALAWSQKLSVEVGGDGGPGRGGAATVAG